MPIARGRGLKLIGTVDVCLTSAMAHLAGQATVVGIIFQIINFAVAIEAGLVSGIHDAKRGDFLGRRRPIVPVFTECLRDQNPPRRYKRHYRKGKKYDQGNDLTGNSGTIQTSPPYYLQKFKLFQPKETKIILTVNIIFVNYR